MLDEPNAALDSISEYDLSNMYRSLLKNKMGIIIAHRFNNFIKYVDKVIILENGEILEMGNHDDLIDSNKLYNDLYSFQQS